MSNRRTGLPVALKMRHNAHYVEEIISRSGAAIGRMVPIEDLQPNADQPRKDRGDLSGLVESVREKGVLEPLLVRYLAEAQKYMIISGERRYHAARAAGLREIPATLEIALIENLQRKDLTPFEEADGLQALADRFALTHDEIGHKIGKARSSVTESLSLRAIPDAVKALAIEKAVLAKGQLLQVARQPDEARMKGLVLRFAQGSVNRDQARAERQKKSRPTVFTFVAPTKDFKLSLTFRKANVPREEIILALRKALESLEADS